MPKILLGISILLMTLSAVLGYLNTNKVKALHGEVEKTTADYQNENRLRLAKEKEIKAKDEVVAAATAKATEADAKATSIQADLSKAQAEKADLQTREQADEVKVAELQKRLDELLPKGVVPGTPMGPSAPELQAQMDELKKQLDAAEREKALLADKVKSADNRVKTFEEEKQRRDAGLGRPGVHGTVLAVNQAYNFVVLSLGDRQGIVQNSEMLIVRGGSVIGKLRITSVEPSTAIGDIVTNSLSSGAQVQPGDTVIYAGNTTNS